MRSSSAPGVELRVLRGTIGSHHRSWRSGLDYPGFVSAVRHCSTIRLPCTRNIWTTLVEKAYRKTLTRRTSPRAFLPSICCPCRISCGASSDMSSMVGLLSAPQPRYPAPYPRHISRTVAAYCLSIARQLVGRFSSTTVC